MTKLSTFRALVSVKDSGKITASFQNLTKSDLPPGDVLARVSFSTLNYKDGLTVTGQPGLIRKFPMVPGIDFAGTVEESSNPAFHPGDQIVATGFGMGETIWGGYSQYARVPAEHLVKLPPGISLQQAMGIGTAGFTAMQCVLAPRLAGEASW